MKWSPINIGIILLRIYGDRALLWVLHVHEDC
jgi:hypothetical protein